MKKTLPFLLLFIMAATLTAQAQITKRSKLIGGSLVVGTTKQENNMNISVSKSTTVRVLPSFGLAIKENLVVGVSLLYSRLNQKYGPPQYTTKLGYDMYGGGVFVRKYKQLAKSDFYLFGDAGLNYVATKEYREEEAVRTFNTKGNNIGLAVSPGLSYAVNNRLHLELGLSNLLQANVSFSKQTNGQNDDVIKQNGFNLSSSVSEITNNISFGVRFLLTK
jgi:opacity protein-like surface antigen